MRRVKVDLLDYMGQFIASWVIGIQEGHELPPVLRWQNTDRYFLLDPDAHPTPTYDECDEPLVIGDLVDM